MKRLSGAAVLIGLHLGACAGPGSRIADPRHQDGMVALFPDEGVVRGWSVRHWSDVAKPPPQGAVWKVENGVLHGSTVRGTWLVSDELFSDFVLEFEFRLGEQGNSGVGLRFPDAGDPAFDGLEMQMVDARYYGDAGAGPDQLTGALYQASAPRVQVYRPGQWNTCRISCIGPRVEIVLNGDKVQDLDLNTQTGALQRGSALKDRARRGHIGFQELSRGDGHVEIRGARIGRLAK